MTHEKSCGAVVFRRHHGNLEVLLVKHINSGHWSFPKGHTEEGESEQQTAMREVKEETGVDISLDPTFRETVTYYPRKDTQKVVVYFLAGTKSYETTPQEGEIAEVRWVDVGFAKDLLTYENDKALLTRAKAVVP